MSAFSVKECIRLEGNSGSIRPGPSSIPIFSSSSIRILKDSCVIEARLSKEM